MYSDQQIKDTLTAGAPYKNDKWVVNDCVSFWSVSENIPLAKKVMDTLGKDLPHPNDYAARYTFLWLARFFKQFNLPYPENPSVCPNIKALKTAFQAERSRIQTDRLTQYAVTKWIDMQGGALSLVEGYINGLYATLNCDQVINTQQQTQQIDLLTQATDKAITTSDGNGINYTMWAVIAIVIVVLIVVIKKLSGK